jgi:type I restriction enzyme S subunit
MSEPLPKDWSWKPLGDLAEVVSGGTPSKNEPAFWEGGTIPWATPSDITKTPGRVLLETGEKLTDLGLSASAARKLPIGSVLMTSRATLGEARVAGVATATNQGFKSLIPKAGVDSWYLFYQIQNSKARYSVFGKGTTFLEVNTKDTLRLPIPHCQPPQQRRIATILTTLDEVIEATEKLVEKHQQIKAGLMHDLFTRGLWTQAELARGEHNGTPAEATAKEGQLRPTPEEAPGLYQDSPLGMIPKAWSFASISNLGIVKGGKRLPAGTPFSETPTQFPYLRVTDMVDGWIDDSALEFVDPRIEPLIANYKIFKNDIYVTIAGTLGQFGRIPPHLDGAQLTENAARITEIDQERVCLDFMCAFLRSNLMAPQKFKAYGLGAGVPKLALYQIERFILPLPSIEEQKIAETVLASAQNDIRSNLTHLAKLRQQKQGLMHDLLTGRVWVDAACDA